MEEKREGSRSLSQQEEDALQSIARSDLGGLFKARMDEGFTLLYANDSYYAIHGYTRGQLEQEMHGQAVGLVHPEDVAWVSEHLRRALAENQGTVSFEYRIVRRDGAVVWLLISAGLSQEDGGMVLSGMILDITARKAMEDRLRRSEERFQIAVRQAGISVWEYDIPARRLYSSVSTQGHGEACPVVEQVPQSLIDSGYVHPSGVKEFQGMHEALHRGEPTASCVVQVRSPQGGYRWERIHYTTLFDDRRRPVWAVAIVEDVSDQKYAERRCMQEEQLREMLSVDVLISGKVNLTKNQVEELWGHRSFPAAFQKVQDCDGLFQLMGEYLANAEERKRYRALFRRQALLAKYRAGDRGIWGEYRCVNFDGEILWAALRATIHEDPETGDILLFGYVRDIDSRKKTELALLERAEKDGVTGLYNKATIQTMIQRILQERRGSGGQCALLVIDLDNFKQVNDRYGHLQGDKLLQEIGHILHASFQQKGLVGRIGGDEFVLFLGEIPSEQWVLEQTDALCRMLNIAYEAAEDHVPVSASIGVGLAPHSQAQYEELFRQADAGLYHAKQQGKARYSCCRDEGFLEGEGTVTSLQCAAKEHLGTHCMLDALEDMLFVIDLETYEMRYMNAPARAAFGYEEGAYAGRKCYQVLQGFSQPCVFCQNHLPSEQGFKTWENQNVRLHRRFLIRDKIIQWDGRPARLEIYQAPAAQEEARENAEHVLLEMAGLLLSAESLEDGIQGTLGRLGGFYGADRCYVVQARLGERTFQAAQQWQSPALQARGNAAAQTLEGAGWLEHLKARHLVACHDVEQLQQVFPEKYRDMRARGVRSFYAVALLEEGELRGYLGIDNPRERLECTTMLLSLSHFLMGERSKREGKAQNAFLRSHDALTGCLNWERYNDYLVAFSNDVSSSLGVLRADVNQLAELNQRRGKEAGDRMVCHVAQVLRRRFGPGNVYRINGDEFVVFRTDVTYRKFAGDVEACQQLLEEQAPGAVAFGWTWADQDIQIQGMVHHAGEALQLEKQRHGKGKGAWGQQAFWGLEEAFAKGHFHIYLQPKAEIASGRIRGAEALIRYRDDQHGVVGPDKFIPQLERSGLIRHIDLFVLEEVCRTLRRWREQGVEPIPISLNLSRYTLMEKGILARINGITSRYQVDRRLLKLEITESIGDVERRILEEISREIVGDGYCLSLDDFGAQYSNLSILSSLQLSELKIDKSIINDLYSNQNTRILVEHLIHICRQLGIDSVAEGVEEREQLQILEDIGCTYAQGYLYNKPIPVPDFERKYLAGPGNDP